MASVWVPDRDQLRAKRFLTTNLNSGLFQYPGFGKTSVVLAAFKDLRRRNKVSRMLVVAPIRPAYMVWPEEPTLWEQFKDFKVTVLHGKKKEQVINEPADIQVINYDGLGWLINTPWFKKNRRPWDVVVFDESGGIKNTSTNRHRNAKSLRKKVPNCWILNGSPLPRSYQDLFGQFRIMNGGKSFGTVKGEFLSSYFRKSGWGMRKYTVTAKGKKQIKRIVQDTVFCVDKKPGSVEPEYFNLYIDFPPELMTKYKQFLKNCIMKTPEGKVTAVNAGALTQKALQFTGGNIFLDSDDPTKKKAHHLHDLKEERLIELIEEYQGNPILIGYLYKHELARLKKILTPYGNPVPHLQDADDIELVNRWNRGELQVLLGYPRVMGHGLNLQKFPEGDGVVVFYSVNHNYEYYDQMIRRIARRGFTRPVRVYHLVVRNTIDEAILQCLKDKGNNQDDFMNHIVGYWEKFYDEEG